MDLCPGCDRPENDHDPRCFMLNFTGANRPSPLSAGLDPAFVAKAIDDEPALEGEMPDEIWEAIKTKKDLQAYSVLIVHLTKKGIKERLGV